jgi:hypothetical protein
MASDFEAQRRDCRIRALQVTDDCGDHPILDGFRSRVRAPFDLRDLARNHTLAKISSATVH